MAHDASAYAALGLEPGADATAIERAYKRLIKQHHPDREGGDSDRAAEINRAYRELRAELGPKDALVFNDVEPPERTGSGWIRAAIVLLLALVVLLAVSGPVAAYMRQLVQPEASVDGDAAGAATGNDAMDQPLHLAAVSGAVRHAVAMLGKHDETALLTESRDCHRTLRIEPSVVQLDRCAAFDDAIVQVEDRDPMWDQGPFSQIAVTGRQWSAASALSNDYLAIDSRLDRIRIQVELALAPPDPPRLPPPLPLNPVVNSAEALDGNVALPEAPEDAVKPN
ncbi:MAG TPA: J domain-containing protein [Sphingomicrobium sp.]|nr:J domain-containing protein [Sphingomicrobium sp.]